MTKRKRIGLAFGVLLLGLAGYGYSQFAGTSSGSILPSDQADASDVQPTSVPIADTYASFSYPSSYVIVSSEQPSLPVLARHNMSSKNNNHAQIAIQISHLGNGNIQDDGSYNFRNSTPSRFTKQIITAGTNKVTVFIDTATDGFSKVGYLQHDSLSVSIALSGPFTDTNATLDHDFLSVLSSWQWR